MKVTLLPVILSGGAGSRLGPVSREFLPKPFIQLADGETLLTKTCRRGHALPDADSFLTVTNREYYFLTRDDYEASGQGGGDTPICWNLAAVTPPRPSPQQRSWLPNVMVRTQNSWSSPPTTSSRT